MTERNVHGTAHIFTAATTTAAAAAAATVAAAASITVASTNTAFFAFDPSANDACAARALSAAAAFAVQSSSGAASARAVLQPREEALVAALGHRRLRCQRRRLRLRQVRLLRRQDPRHRRRRRWRPSPVRFGKVTAVLDTSQSLAPLGGAPTVAVATASDPSTCTAAVAAAPDGCRHRKRHRGSRRCSAECWRGCKGCCRCRYWRRRAQPEAGAERGREGA